MVESTLTTAIDLRSAIEVALAAGVVTRDEILDMVSTDGPDAGSNGHVPAELMRGADDLPIYAEAPPGMIDLPTVARVYGINARTAKGWIVRGQLQVLGKVQGRGGPRYLVCEETIAKMAQQPKNKGGRPRKT